MCPTIIRNTKGKIIRLSPLEAGVMAASRGLVLLLSLFSVLVASEPCVLANQVLASLFTISSCSSAIYTNVNFTKTVTIDFALLAGVNAPITIQFIGCKFPGADVNLQGSPSASSLTIPTTVIMSGGGYFNNLVFADYFPVGSRFLFYGIATTFAITKPIDLGNGVFNSSLVLFRKCIMTSTHDMFQWNLAKFANSRFVIRDTYFDADPHLMHPSKFLVMVNGSTLSFTRNTIIGAGGTSGDLFTAIGLAFSYYQWCDNIRIDAGVKYEYPVLAMLGNFLEQPCGSQTSTSSHSKEVSRSASSSSSCALSQSLTTITRPQVITDSLSFSLSQGQSQSKSTFVSNSLRLTKASHSWSTTQTSSAGSASNEASMRSTPSVSQPPSFTADLPETLSVPLESHTESHIWSASNRGSTVSASVSPPQSTTQPISKGSYSITHSVTSCTPNTTVLSGISTVAAPPLKTTLEGGLDMMTQLVPASNSRTVIMTGDTWLKVSAGGSPLSLVFALSGLSEWALAENETSVSWRVDGGVCDVPGIPFVAVRNESQGATAVYLMFNGMSNCSLDPYSSHSVLFSLVANCRAAAMTTMLLIPITVVVEAKERPSIGSTEGVLSKVAVGTSLISTSVTSSSMVSRVAAMESLILCSVDGVLLGDDGLLGLVIGTDDINVYRGTVVGNIIVLVAPTIAALFMAVLYHLVTKKKLLSVAVGRVHLPSVMLPIVALMTPSTVSSSIMLIEHGSAADASLGCLALIGIPLSGLAGLSWMVYRRFKFEMPLCLHDKRSSDSPHLATTWASKWKAILVERHGKWTGQSPRQLQFASRWQVILFESRLLWYPLLDEFVVAIVGFASVMPDIFGSSRVVCFSAVSTVMLLTLLQLLICIFRVPFLTHLTRIYVIANLSVSLILMCCQILFINKPYSEPLLLAVHVLTSTFYGLAMAKNAIDVIDVARGLRRYVLELIEYCRTSAEALIMIRELDAEEEPQTTTTTSDAANSIAEDDVGKVADNNDIESRFEESVEIDGQLLQTEYDPSSAIAMVKLQRDVEVVKHGHQKELPCADDLLSAYSHSLFVHETTSTETESL